VLDLKEDLLIFYILNLSIINTVLLREMRMDSMKVSKCLFEPLKRDTKSHTCAPSFLTVSVCVGSFNKGSEVPTPVGSS
jgi:hypothetical protein